MQMWFSIVDETSHCKQRDLTRVWSASIVKRSQVQQLLALISNQARKTLGATLKFEVPNRSHMELATVHAN